MCALPEGLWWKPALRAHRYGEAGNWGQNCLGFALDWVSPKAGISVQVVDSGSGCWKSSERVGK